VEEARKVLDLCSEKGEEFVNLVIFDLKKFRKSLDG